MSSNSWNNIAAFFINLNRKGVEEEREAIISILKMPVLFLAYFLVIDLEQIPIFDYDYNSDEDDEN
jgi:hypothetical protein